MSMTRTRTSWLVIGCLWIAAQSAAIAQDAPATGSPPQISVLDAGQEPRNALRYRFDDGISESASLEMTIRLNVSMGGAQQQVVAFPTVRMQVKLGPIAVADDNSARFDFAIGSAELIDGADTNPGLAAALRGSLGALPSVTGWARIDAQGAMLAGDLSFADGVDPQLTQVFDSAEQSLRQMTAPLPTEPVGLGARWQATQQIESAGFDVTQIVVYRLAAIAANEVTLEFELAQTGSDQAADFAGLPPGVEAVNRMSSD
jgi:hypothetical protein